MVEFKKLNRKSSDTDQNTDKAGGEHLLYSDEYREFTKDAMSNYLGIDFSDEEAIDDMYPEMSLEESASREANKQESRSESMEEHNDNINVDSIQQLVRMRQQQGRLYVSRHLMKESRDVIHDIEKAARRIVLATPSNADDRWVSGHMREVIDRIQMDNSIPYYDVAEAVAEYIPEQDKNDGICNDVQMSM